MESSAKYTLVGSFVLGAFVLIVLGVLWLSNKGLGEDSKFYTIYFRNQTLDGLQLNSSVTMKGIKVGIVDKLGISKKSIELVQVIIRIEQSTPIKIDTKATINRNLLTGLAMVELVGGKQESLDLVALQQDEPYPIIPEGKSELDAVASSIPELMRDTTEVVGQLREILNPENIKSINSTLKNAEKISETLAANGENISKLILSSSSMVAEVEKITANIQQFTNPSSGELAKLSDILIGGAEELKKQIQSIGDKSSQVASELSNSFRVVAQDINTASNSVTQASRSLAATAEHLGDFKSIVTGPDNKSLGPGEVKSE